MAKHSKRSYTCKLLDLYFPMGTDLDQPDTLVGMYLVLEYMQFTLFDMLTKADEKLTREQALILSYNLLCAVKHLHTSNIMHRDLKPENILVTQDMQVKICDFGLSRSIISRKKPGKSARSTSPECFTRFYRPPEVILSQQDYTESSDMWSVGCILSVIFQKTVKSSGQIEMPFGGDSCYPLSPIGQSGDQLNLSFNDQLFTIIRGLGITIEDV